MKPLNPNYFYFFLFSLLFDFSCKKNSDGIEFYSLATYSQGIKEAGSPPKLRKNRTCSGHLEENNPNAFSDSITDEKKCFYDKQNREHWAFKGLDLLEDKCEHSFDGVQTIEIDNEISLHECYLSCISEKHLSCLSFGFEKKGMEGKATCTLYSDYAGSGSYSGPAGESHNQKFGWCFSRIANHDTDSDGIPDVKDKDDDNDTIIDEKDKCITSILTASEGTWISDKETDKNGDGCHDVIEEWEGFVSGASLQKIEIPVVVKESITALKATSAALVLSNEGNNTKVSKSESFSDEEDSNTELNDANTVSEELESDTNSISDSNSLAEDEDEDEIDLCTEDLLISVSSETDTSCYGSSDVDIDISVSGSSGNYSFSWTNSSDEEVSTEEDLEGAEADTYLLTVTDTYCEVSEEKEFEISALTSMTLSVTTNDAKCSGSEDGSSSPSVSGGSGFYSYSWLDASSSEISDANYISGLEAGSYKLVVTDTLCSDSVSTSFSISEPNEMILDISSVTDVTCYGDEDGAVDYEIKGGSGSYTYSWVNIDSEESVSEDEAPGLVAGEYLFTIKDENACEISAEIEILEPSELKAEIYSSTDATCYGFSDGLVIPSVSGGSETYTYKWYDVSTEDIVSEEEEALLGAGTYSLLVNDGDCEVSSEEFSITEPDKDESDKDCDSVEVTDDCDDEDPSVNELIFTENIISESLTGISSIYPGDINGDGDMDIIVGTLNNSIGVVWFENDGDDDPSFTKVKPANSSYKVHSVYGVDITGNGKDDIISAHNTKVYRHSYESEDSAALSRKLIANNVKKVKAFDSVDLDGDNDLDLIAADSHNKKIFWLKNNNLSFQKKLITNSNASKVYSITALNFDPDDDDDIDLIYSSYDLKTTFWLKNDGSENFSSVELASGLTNLYTAHPLDFDGDDDLDVLVSVKTAIKTLTNDGSMSFTTSTLSNELDVPKGFVPVDVEGDGDIDILTSSSSDDRVVLLKNDGSGNFTELVLTTNSDSPFSVHVSDMDGDDDLDVIAASLSDTTLVWLEQSCE